MEKVYEYRDFIMPLILEAGKVIKNVEDVQREVKNEQWWDMVTEYDRKVEDILINRIKATYPEHKYIGEEEMSNKNIPAELTDDPTWIIDPIDGTHNFVRNMPMAGISVGLTICKEQMMGVVYNPSMDELFTAIKGEGAYLNGKRINTSGCKEIRESVMNYEMSIANRNEYYYNLYMFRLKHLIKVIQGFRALGSGVIGLCYVACGRTDAYQLDGVYPWDAAAGTLILTEAGGYVTDSSGKPFDLMNPNFLGAATKELSDQYMEIERRADEENESSSQRKIAFKP